MYEIIKLSLKSEVVLKISKWRKIIQIISAWVVQSPVAGPTIKRRQRSY